MFNTSTLKWKLQQYRLYNKYEFGGNALTFYLRDLFSNSTRSKNYSDFQDYYLEHVIEDNYGIKFDPQTPFDTLKEMFEDGMYLLYDEFVTQPGDTVLDVGSQCGDFALLSSIHSKCKAVFAIEPLPNNMNILNKNISMNGVSNIHPIQAAASYYDGYINLNYTNDMAYKDGGKSSIKVRTIKIDSLNLKALEILKIDVEGFEMDVLYGSIDTIKKFRPQIILETHSKELKRNSLNFLKALGYSLSHEGREISLNNNGMDKVQNLFLSYDL